MPIASTDHVVVPENIEDTDLTIENTDAGVDTDVSTEPAVSEPTFADLGLPEGVVRKLAQNGVTTPFPI